MEQALDLVWLAVLTYCAIPLTALVVSLRRSKRAGLDLISHWSSLQQKDLAEIRKEGRDIRRAALIVMKASVSNDSRYLRISDEDMSEILKGVEDQDERICEMGRKRA